MQLRTPRTAGEQYRRIRAYGNSPEAWGIKDKGNYYAVVIAGQVEYLPSSRKIAWRTSKYGWTRYDQRKRGKQRR